MAATQNEKPQQATCRDQSPVAAAVEATLNLSGWDGKVVVASPDQWAKLESTHGLDLALTPLFVVEPGSMADGSDVSVIYLNPLFGFGKN